MQIVKEPAFLTVYRADGAKMPADDNGGVTLANATTYYVPFGGEAALLQHIHAQWDAAIILTSVEVELASNPKPTLVSAVAGEWIKTNTVGAFASADQVGGALAALTASTAGGAAGGVSFHLALGAARGRLKIVVAGTGGVMKFSSSGKA